MDGSCPGRAPIRLKRILDCSTIRRFPQSTLSKTRPRCASRRFSFPIPSGLTGKVHWSKPEVSRKHQTSAKIRWWRRGCCKGDGESLTLPRRRPTTRTLTVSAKKFGVTTILDCYRVASGGCCVTSEMQPEKDGSSHYPKFGISCRAHRG